MKVVLQLVSNSVFLSLARSSSTETSSVVKLSGAIAFCLKWLSGRSPVGVPTKSRLKWPSRGLSHTHEATL
ncbi:hypothetical protein [Baaleninema simplex]|uniref:hypothetical protein n=1 Tax=Baaleninema simplex TaxID=2862350 RepID=UPI001181A7E2|nr:hypothetical protein [Baaleninema simplex]